MKTCLINAEDMLDYRDSREHLYASGGNSKVKLYFVGEYFKVTVDGEEILFTNFPQKAVDAYNKALLENEQNT